MQSKTVEPSTVTQTIEPDLGVDGLTSVTVNGVTAAVDSNIQPNNIKKDVTILGVTGTLDAPSGSIDITGNGTYDVTLYDTANVNVDTWQRPAEWPDLDYIYEKMGKPKDTILLTCDNSTTVGCSINQWLSLSFYAEVEGVETMAVGKFYDYSDIDNPTFIYQILDTHSTSISNNLVGNRLYPVLVITAPEGGVLSKGSFWYEGRYILEATGHMTICRAQGGTTLFPYWIHHDSRVFDELYGNHKIQPVASINYDAWQIKKITNLTDITQHFFGAITTACNTIKSADLSHLASSINLCSINCNYAYMCNNPYLEYINLAGWDMSGWVINNGFIFTSTGYSRLRTIIPPTSFPKYSFKLSGHMFLSHDSIVGCLNALPQLSEGESCTITLGTYCKAKINDEEKAIATGKGWTIA